MFRRTNCTVHTFDCTVPAATAPPAAISTRVFFHRLCIGADSRVVPGVGLHVESAELVVPRLAATSLRSDQTLKFPLHAQRQLTTKRLNSEIAVIPECSPRQLPSSL